MSVESRLLGVIGVLRDDEGRVLLVERAAGLSGAGLWCFPGGHVEPGEALEAAVERELAEELGLVVRAVAHLGHVLVPRYRLEVFAVERVSGEIAPRPDEVAAARFVPIADVARIERAMPSNAGVLEMLAG